MVHLGADRVAEFRVFAPRAEGVEVVGTVAGDDGERRSMSPMGGGWWSVRLEVGSGDHEFGYLLDGREWLADFAAGGVRREDDGRWVSLLHVPAALGAAA